MIYLFLTFFAALVAGYTVLHRFSVSINDKLISLFSLLLIVLFGYQLNAATEIVTSVTFFLRALALSVASLSGSVLFSIPFFILLKKLQRQNPAPRIEEDSQDTTSSWHYIGIAILTLLLGMAIGSLYKGIDVKIPIQATLHCMVFAIGLHVAFQIRLQKNTGGKSPFRFSAIHGIYLFGLPTSVILGTLVGSSLTGMLIGIGWRDGAFCGAPLGWQTLGGPVVQELRGVSLGSLAFMVNMFRDCLALVLIPFLAMSKLPLLTITPGGVSSMDILLPAIIKSSGREAFIPAVWIGACCSFWAPILLIILHQLDA